MCIIVTLCCILTSSLRLGYYPTAWKRAVVKFIPKSGKDHSSPKGHRPISLLSCLGKLLESVVKTRLNDYAESTEILGHSQAAHRANHCTTDQLFTLSQTASETLQKKGCLAAAFLEVEGAFDRVWHEGLLYKLHSLQCPPFLTKWTTSFLENRSVTVNVNGFTSQPFRPHAGVPQGSVVSAILYNIYVCQMPKMPATLSQFADDIALWYRARSYREASRLLQQSLDKLAHWCQQWRIKLNPTKTQTLLFTRKRGM